MKFRPIFVDDSRQELTQHGTKEFPMSMDRQNVSDRGCAHIPHWHYEVQINLIIKGSVIFRTPAGEFLLHEQQGMFINSGTLHEVIPTEDADSVYICVDFHPNLIYGQSDNMIRRDYVDPILFNEDLSAFPLDSADWHKEICALLSELARVNDAQEYGYEIEMRILLCRIWQRILVNNKGYAERAAAVSFTDKQRMKLLQDYISKNYMENITLADIAEAGHISRGECCRLFGRVQKMPPVKYLIKYRINQSVKLLTCTDINIANIAQQVGFSSSSYYAECFKTETGVSPLQYRRQSRAAEEQE